MQVKTSIIPLLPASTWEEERKRKKNDFIVLKETVSLKRLLRV
jgi:hypothetical protein